MRDPGLHGNCWRAQTVKHQDREHQDGKGGQPGQTRGASGMSDQAHVESVGYHLRSLVALGVERVEAVAYEGEPVVGGADVAQELAVFVGQRLGHDEVTLSLHRHPPR